MINIQILTGQCHSSEEGMTGLMVTSTGYLSIPPPSIHLEFMVWGFRVQGICPLFQDVAEAVGFKRAQVCRVGDWG